MTGPARRTPPFAAVRLPLSVTRYVVLSALMGAAFLAGGPERVSAAAYAFIVRTGGPGWWGAGFLLGAAAIAASSLLARRLLPWALLATGAGYAVLCLAFAAAAAKYDTANFTAPVVYGWVAIMHALAWDRAREETEWTRTPGPS